MPEVTAIIQLALTPSLCLLKQPGVGGMHQVLDGKACASS